MCVYVCVVYVLVRTYGGEGRRLNESCGVESSAPQQTLTKRRNRTSSSSFNTTTNTTTHTLHTHHRPAYAYDALDVGRQALSLLAALVPVVLVAMRDGREGVTVREIFVCVCVCMFGLRKAGGGEMCVCE
jgi:hypothetical protein